jgi:hypothetical protein
MIHNIPQPSFEQFVAEAMAGEELVEVRKGVAYVGSHQVSATNSIK